MPRFRMAAPAPAETDIHAAVADALAVLLLPPAAWTTSPAGHVALPPAVAAKLARLGLKRGIPDVLIWHGGRSYGIELKRRGGRLSRTRTVRTRHGALRVVEGQTETFPRLEAAGMQIAVCETVPAVLAALAEWGVPVRRWAV
ncbi:MAG: hypothetical protein ACP5NP_08150 [Acetobacteraceae bacterium]